MGKAKQLLTGGICFSAVLHNGLGGHKKPLSKSAKDAAQFS
jgi:hypothetical protein